jgi:S-adenosylmethionine synthetase
VGTGLSRVDPPRIRKVDVTDFEALKSVIDEIKPSVIVHWYFSFRLVNSSAAERRPEAAENPEKKEEVIKLNVKVPEFLGEITKEKGILLIYISTGIDHSSC